MSLPTLPAAPGTYLIEREQGAKEATRIPVLGYTYVQGGVVFPLCAIAKGGLAPGRALVTPDGFVTDPSYGIVCGTIDEWMALTNSEAYWTAKSKIASVTPPVPPSPEEPINTIGRVLLENETTAEEIDKAVAETGTWATPMEPVKRIPDRPVGKLQEFLNATFWSMPKSNAIFKLEGGTPAPAKKDTRFEKIKRDDFMRLKKAGASLLSDWQSGVVAEAPVDEDVGDGSDLI